MQSPRRRTSKNKGKQQQSMSRIPARLTVLMGIVVVMLGALGWRLATLQIVQGPTFKALVSQAEASIEQVNVQRGMIYDSTGKTLVSNKGSQAITYTKPRNVTEKGMFKVANEVGAHVKIDADKLSDVNYAKFYILDDERMAEVAKLSGTKYNPGTDNYVKDLMDYALAHLDELKLNDKQKNSAMMYQKMQNAYALSTVYLKESDVSQDEIAAVGERQSLMPGVRVGLYYKRAIPKGESDALKSLVGNVSTSKTGLPEGSVDSMLTQGYSRDDSVGTSYLEKQYEPVLKGSKRIIEVSTDSKGDQQEKSIYAGKAGSNLTLTINAKLQDEIQQALHKRMPGGNTEGAYAVVMNSKTGGIYALNGITRGEDGKVMDDAMGTINRGNVVGSVVKPAMITTGLMNKAITPESNTFTDTPIKVEGTSIKSSWFNRAGENSMPLTAPEALEVSSNSYVMQLMLKMAGAPYKPDMSLSKLNLDVFQKMRDGYARFGLGQRTGIDLPGEVTGIKGPVDNAHKGNALDASFGQYDTYTTIQLAQYVSAIANGGYRMRPHVVSKIEDRENGRVKQPSRVATTINPEVLGSVGWTPAERQLIWDGMRLVVHGDNKFVTGTPMKDVKPQIYAKTGTAETFTKGKESLTFSLISFVPDSDVAVAVVVAGVADSQSTVNQDITKDIYEAFWKNVTNPKDAHK